MVNKDNNVNDSVNENLKSNNNNNDIDDKSKQYARGRQVENLGYELQKKLNADDKSLPFLFKVAWKLSEARIWYNVETALKGSNPMGLFIYLCKRDGV